MTTSDVIISRIKQLIPSAEIKATDMTGGGDHWNVVIKAQEFKGLSLIEQHQLVYKALGQMMKQEIHALALDTRVAE